MNSLHWERFGFVFHHLIVVRDEWFLRDVDFVSIPDDCYNWIGPLAHPRLHDEPQVYIVFGELYLNQIMSKILHNTTPYNEFQKYNFDFSP